MTLSLINLFRGVWGTLFATGGKLLSSIKMSNVNKLSMI